MFAKQILDFNSNILSLRSFLDLIEPILLEQRRSVQDKVKPIIFKGVFSNLLNKKKGLKDGEKDRIKEIIKNNEEKIFELYNTELDINIDDFSIKDNEISFNTLSITATKESDFSDNIEMYFKSNRHLKLLYKNTLISMLSAVEWFYSQILHFFYDKNPEAAGISQKTMTLEDLKSFSDIKIAEKHLIDSKIEDLLRGSLDSWIELLKRELKLKMGYLDPNKDLLIEIFQRRNLFVHNGGIVNSIYLSKVNDVFKGKAKIDDEIEIDYEYLDKAIRLYQLSFILIAAELWKKLDSADKERSNVLFAIIYENLLSKRWDIAEGLCIFIKQDGNMDSESKTVAQLNYFLCKKRQGKYDEIKNEIENADFSDKADRYKLGLYSLLDDSENFFKLLPDVMSSNKLTIKELEEFPIFDEMRSAKTYEEFKTLSPFFKPK